MWIEITPTKQFVNIDHNMTYLSSQLLGEQIGLKGKLSRLIAFDYKQN